MSFVIPSVQEDRKIINNALKEFCNHLTIKNAADDAIRDICETLNDNYDMKSRVVHRLAKVMHKQDWADKADAFEEFETEYEILVKGIK